MQVKLEYEVHIDFDYESKLYKLGDRKWQHHVFRGTIDIDYSVLDYSNLMKESIRNEIYNQLISEIEEINDEFPCMEYNIKYIKLKYVKDEQQNRLGFANITSPINTKNMFDSNGNWNIEFITEARKRIEYRRKIEEAAIIMKNCLSPRDYEAWANSVINCYCQKGE